MTLVHDNQGRELKDQIGHLREFHKIEIINCHLHGVGYAGLCLKRMTNSLGQPHEYVLKLWKIFHDPDPWEILSNGNFIDSVYLFQKAFSRACWSDSGRKRWSNLQARDKIFHRIFKICTRHSQGLLSFTDFVKLVSGFQNEDFRTRLPLAFAVLDANDDGFIDPREFNEIINWFDLLYSRKHHEEVSDVRRRMHIGKGVNFEDFSSIVALLPNSFKTFFQVEEESLLQKLHTKSKSVFKHFSM